MKNGKVFLLIVAMLLLCGIETKIAFGQNAPLDIVASSKLEGTTGVPFTATFEVAGGTAPRQFKPKKFNLPKWLDVLSNKKGKLNVGGTTTAGAYPAYLVAVDGSGAKVEKLFVILINDNKPKPAFKIECSPTVNTVIIGGQVGYTLKVIGVDGFNDSVQLSTQSSKGILVNLSSRIVVPDALVDMNVSTESTIAPNRYTITVTGQSGGVMKSTSCDLIVDSKPPAPTPVHIENDRSLPGSYEGESDQVQFRATGGSGLYLWGVDKATTTAKFPISISDNGVLTRSPKTGDSGSFEIGISVADKNNLNNNTIAVFSFIVHQGPVNNGLSVKLANGRTFTEGDSVDIELRFDGPPGTYDGIISLLNSPGGTVTSGLPGNQVEVLRIANVKITTGQTQIFSWKSEIPLPKCGLCNHTTYVISAILSNANSGLPSGNTGDFTINKK